MKYITSLYEIGVAESNEACLNALLGRHLGFMTSSEDFSPYSSKTKAVGRFGCTGGLHEVRLAAFGGVGLMVH